MGSADCIAPALEDPVMPNRGARILVVDDDPFIVTAVRRGLVSHGYHIEDAETLEQARRLFSQRPPDVILLDLGLPDGDGIDLVRWVRAERSTPIVVLSARESEGSKVDALTAGADDYLTKPFGMRELLARIQVALRHAAKPDSGTDAVVRAGDLELDLDRRTLSRAGAPIRLTPTEFDLLKTLMTNPDRIMTHRMLLTEVWGGVQGTDQHYLHVYVGQLRRKLDPTGSEPRHIVTEPGVGYRFVARL
jgi:two-component system KDP operon response regulator KdpE